MAGGGTLVVYPEAIRLVGPFSVERLLVLAEDDGGRRIDITREASIECMNPAIAGIGSADGEARPAVLPASDGATHLRVAWRGRAIELPVTVAGLAEPAPPSFENDVVARLTRAGCNGGACHGAQHGKGGFKLSLLGYEAEDDHVTITRESEGRRVVLFDPPRSLILEKPLLAVPHAGGRRLEPGSASHRAIESWLEAGAPGPSPAESAPTSVEIHPGNTVLAPGEEALLVVTARFPDGSLEDISGKALLSSLDDGVAALLPGAVVKASGAGETSIMARYRGLAAVSRVTVPFRRIEGYPEIEARGFIDELASRKWKSLGILPSKRSSDADFLRRVYLSAIGTIPSAEEARRFLDDAAPDKREKLIDEVLSRPEYVDYWTLRWGDILRIDRQKMGEKGMWSFYSWVRTAVREDRPLDRFVEELITAQGSTFISGPANYYRSSRKPQELAETTSQVFLGLRLQCAQCHHHPFEKWSQDDYYGMAAYFGRLGVKGSSEFGVYGEEQVVFVKKDGEVRHPKKGKTVAPKPLDADPADDDVDRRRALARWLTSKDNRLFARNLANRFWGYMFGRGIVEPVDDLRVTNPPSNPELLDALADELVKGGFRQKHIIRTILRSSVFELSSRENREDGLAADRFFARYPVRRLQAEVLLDAIAQVTAVPERFPGLPSGTRAIQLPDARFESYFLQSFGKPRREIACECERVSLPNMAQALHLMNGDFIGGRIEDSKGRAGRLISEKTADGPLVEELYLAALGRRPEASEAARAGEYLAAAPSRKEGVEDLLWALLNSSEFVFHR